VGVKPSVVFIRVNILNQSLKPARAKNNHQQAQCAGDWNGADTDHHQDHKDYRGFNSCQGRRMHVDLTGRLLSP
jgi:hypothetical protein